ncbi:MAG: hypothetical protein BWY15_02448 [Firmicutes bacterium ADurb.Bin193]|nr:MAG: hypothetical protein BWY15_02448 [Firmicutes bacterium ADurb.Bin193]
MIRTHVSVSVRALCNTILKKAFDEGIDITPMKMQKLIYFIYKDFLKRTGSALFRENFLAWKNGPVLNSVYDEFKSFRAHPITRFAKDAQGKVFLISEDAAEDILDSISDVWGKYKYFSGIELSNLTHKEGSAWYKAYTSSKDYLETEDILYEE